MKKIKNLFVFGPVEGPTGYDDHTRMFIKSFVKMGLNVKVHHHDAWCGAKISHPLDGMIKNLRNKQLQNIDAAIHMCLPDQCPMLNGVPNFNFTMFEADRIPQRWAMASNAMFGTFVTNDFCRQAWINSGACAHKIKLATLGFDLDAAKYDQIIYPLYTDRGEFIGQSFSLRFLYVGELVERKNISGLIKAWIKATRNIETDAILILKLYSYSSSRLLKFHQDVEQISHEFVGSNQCAPIVIFEQMLSEEEMYALYNLATHYISMSRGEGWDLSAIKMAGLGKNLVVPWHSAYKSYLPKDLVYPIVAEKLIPAKQSGGTSALFRGANWFDVDEASAIHMIRNALYDARQTNEPLKKYIRENFSYDRAAQKLVQEMEDSINCKDPIPEIKTKLQPSALVLCSSLDKRCGIAEYTKKLFSGFTNGQKTMNIFASNSSCEAIVSAYPSTCADGVVHFQHEYGILDAKNFASAANELRRRGVKIVLTQHSVSREAILSNDLLVAHADKIILHTHQQYLALLKMGYKIDEKVEIIPHGMDPIIDRNQKFKNVLEINGKIPIAFFGFCFPHKGIAKLLVQFAQLRKERDDILLVLLSNKHEHDHQNYFNSMRDLTSILGLVEHEDFIWEERYIDETVVKELLAQCAAVVLPYDEYGAVGASGAVMTAMSSGTPVFVSDACWFSELTFLPRIELEKDDWLKVIVDESQNEIFAQRYQRSLLAHVERTNWSAIADQHKRLYEALLHGRI